MSNATMPRADEKLDWERFPPKHVMVPSTLPVLPAGGWWMGGYKLKARNRDGALLYCDMPQEWALRSPRWLLRKPDGTWHSAKSDVVFGDGWDLV